MNRPAQSSAESAEILLTTSAQLRSRPLVRSGVVAVAERQQMPQADIDEISAVIDEALTMLVSHSTGLDEDARIHIQLSAASGNFQMKMARSDCAVTSDEAADKFRDAVASSGVAVVMEPERSWLHLSKQF